MAAANFATSLHHYHNHHRSVPYLQFRSQMLHHRQPRISTIPLSRSFSPHRRRRRRSTRRNPNKRNDSSQSSSSDSGKLQFVLDVDQLKTKTPLSLQRALSLCESKFHEFVSSGTDAYNDLRSLVIVEPGSNRIVVSCSDSTVRFMGSLMLWSCLGVVFIRILINLGLGLRRRSGEITVAVVKRRDRSLGGREVVVEKRVVEGAERKSDLGMNERDSGVISRNSIRKEQQQRKLPNWWPVIGPRPVVEVLREDYRTAANKLVQAIMDDKLRGKDVSEEDILELHRICRVSGVQLSFGTENARDSFYRLAVHNVINTCCRAGNPSVQIDGEDARLFVAGLAYDVGLSNSRAATIVSAAVAAQTRLWFLQAWALEMQAKNSEAMEELKKICLIHQIFPPEPSSAEMEMVARGLQQHLKPEHRELLLTKLVSVCGEESPRSAAEALGLV
ncbi:hypothetical protein SOVF_193640 [Spinacia oleracea]|nr:hypothetical protein SOVF_193640 [Spinacia oleracea]